MALSMDKKLYVALAVLAGLGGALYLQKQKARDEALSYTPEGREADLPQIKATEESNKKIDKITILQPESKDDDKDKDAGADKKKEEKPPEVVLEKKGDEWRVVKPIDALANQANVKSLLENLVKLRVRELISKSKSAYEEYDLTDDKAVHITFNAGKDVVHDLFFGASGGRGQMARIGKHEGVYAVKGYSSYLYTRDLKGWRDLTIFKFDEKKVKSVSIQNENGKFEFTKDGSEWKSKHNGAAIPKFKSSKVDDMLRAYKSLNANAFGEDKQPGDIGLEPPTATVAISLEDGGKRILKVGDKAEGSSRWVQVPDNATIYSISSWAADWSTAEADKFQEKEKKKDEDKDDEGDDKSDKPASPHNPHGQPAKQPVTPTPSSTKAKKPAPAASKKPAKAAHPAAKPKGAGGRPGG